MMTAGYQQVVRHVQVMIFGQQIGVVDARISETPVLPRNPLAMHCGPQAPRWYR